MKAKNTENGRHTEVETLTEAPSLGTGQMTSSFSPKSKNEIEQNETEVEDVEGFVITRPGEDDKEVTNTQGTENETGKTILEDSGVESFLPGDDLPKEAFFASYSNLLPLAREQKDVSEVIIGADNRVRINNTVVYPWRAICALKITAKNGSRWIGTGWLVAPRTIITAGHCVYMHDQGGWASKIEVIPGMNDAQRPYGTFTGTTFKSVNGWINSKNRNYDYGAIILPANARPGAATGYFGYAVKDDSYLKASVLNLSGYPGDKGGNQQWFMSLKPKSVSSRVINYDIDTFGGQSGAPVWIKIGNDRFCIGIHTNGHISGNSATRIVQPVFDNIKSWKALGM
jgi:glutamyl endopeptidase